MTDERDQTQDTYIDPEGAMRLARAIMTRGVLDAKAGYPDALLWLDGDGFAHWCEWLDIDAGRAREAIHAGRARRRRQMRFTFEQVQEIRELYAAGQTWEHAMAGVLGFFNENLRKEIVRYTDGMAQAEAAHADHLPRPQSKARPETRLTKRSIQHAK